MAELAGQPATIWSIVWRQSYSQDGGDYVKRYEDLDGLRAIAILSVMYAHFLYDSAIGMLGVWLFFVLSGYLITGILLRCRDEIEKGRATPAGTFKTFYVRRALRILPIYYLCLIGTWVVGDAETRNQIWWHAAFSSNLLFMFHPLDWLTVHFWTLAIEEQFYLFWPAVILLTPRRMLPALILTFIAVAPVYRTIAIALEFPAKDKFLIPTIACFDALGMGALLALTENQVKWRTLLLTLGALSIPIPFCVAIFSWKGGPLIMSLEFTLCALAFAWLIAQGVSGKVRALAFLRSPLFVEFGVVSYGAYVFHKFAAKLINLVYVRLFEHSLGSGPRLFFLASTATLVVASLSWRFYEAPINALKRYFPYSSTWSPSRESISRPLSEEGGALPAELDGSG
jgi:peptidoglycan/LPS O-acetylase OafA/YrhL